MHFDKAANLLLLTQLDTGAVCSPLAQAHCFVKMHMCHQQLLVRQVWLMGSFQQQQGFSDKPFPFARRANHRGCKTVKLVSCLLLLS